MMTVCSTCHAHGTSFPSEVVFNADAWHSSFVFAAHRSVSSRISKHAPPCHPHLPPLVVHDAASFNAEQRYGEYVHPPTPVELYAQKSP
jgi:hypothetical protein